VVALREVRQLPPASGAGAARELVGREGELDLIRTFLDEAAAEGAALVVSGEPGTGKTALLDAAAAFAMADGARVLRAVGVEFEATLSFSGLNQVLSPLLSDTSGLEPVHLGALRVALGFGDGPRPDRLLVSNATMALLRHAAARRPLLVIIDDAQWLDRASATVLGFAARRAVPRVGFLWATRPGPGSLIERSDIPVHVLAPISDDAAAVLLDDRFPALAPRVRQRLVVEAEGNPLALMELPTALGAPQLAAVEALPDVLPLTARLQALFEGRIKGLPGQTQRLLLLTALDGAGDLQVLRAAADAVELFDDLAPAERENLIFLDDHHRRLNFRHPLIRSSVVQLSTGAERRGAHRALARALLHQPDRHAWHLAEATLDPNEQVATLLDQAAHRMLRRGDLSGAMTASTRAASLSPVPGDRARRLAQGAWQGARMGEFRTGSRMLAVARQTDPAFTGSLADAAAAALLLMIGDGDIATAHRLLVEALQAHPNPWDAEDGALIEALHTLSVTCIFGGQAKLWKPFHEAVSRLTPHAPLDLLLTHTVSADPARATASSLARLDHAVAGLKDETDVDRIVRISYSARFVDRLSLCREPLGRIVRESVCAGVIEARALGHLCLDDFFTGRWDEAERLASEGVQLSEVQAAIHVWRFRYVRALLAAVRGDDDTNRALCDELTSWATPRGALGVQRNSLHARTLATIGRSDFEEAYRSAAAVSPPGEFPSHAEIALFVCMDLVEAAVRTNRLAQANAHVAAMREEGIAALSPRLALLVAGSAAIAATDDVASELYERALAVPDTDRWPFDRARVQLAYGEHLRRTRSTSCSRAHLSAALDIFQRLGARPWASRASNELRATGQVRLTDDRLHSNTLTPQEQAIASLAASGLSNKQIAERLYLSHRTVASHLHRAFPKLGITSRAALRDALTSGNQPTRQSTSYSKQSASMDTQPSWSYRPAI